LLARRPGIPIPNQVTLESVDTFLKEQRRLYPQNYQDDPAPAQSTPVVTKAQVEAAIAEKIGSSTPPVPTQVSQKENLKMSIAKTLADSYIQTFQARGTPLSFEEQTAVHGYAEKFAQSAELQREYEKIGGFACFAAGERAMAAGRVKLYGGIHRK
jgi:hypothetical protein